MQAKTIGFFLIAIAFLILFVVFYRNSQESDIPVIFSERDMLLSLWRGYKNDYIEDGSFRAIDRQRDDVTTSEGQSYTLLRAVWMDDKETFDRALEWTENNLGREEDALFSWLYGEREDGTYGVLIDEGGYNTATDADTDIALALIFAYAQWDEEEYLDKAREIVRDVWEKEVVVVNGRPYLAANDVEKTSTSEYIVINPSYFSPYAYRIFAQIDPEHPWGELVDSSYELLARSMEDPLNTENSAGLPPDWVLIHEETGELSAPSANNELTTNYSYDALRTSWRIALDYQWFNEPRAKEILDTMDYLTVSWSENEQLFGRYAHDGEIVESTEPPAMYGGSIGYFTVSSPEAGEEVYRKKLQFLYNPDIGSWKNNLSYYDSNWAWFGIALYNNLLPNLATHIPEAELTGRDTETINFATTERANTQ